MFEYDEFDKDEYDESDLIKVVAFDVLQLKAIFDEEVDGTILIVLTLLGVSIVTF